MHNIIFGLLVICSSQVVFADQDSPDKSISFSVTGAESGFNWYDCYAIEKTSLERMAEISMIASSVTAAMDNYLKQNLTGGGTNRFTPWGTDGMLRYNGYEVERVACDLQVNVSNK